MIRITEKTHPVIYDSLDAISHDCGGRAGHDFYPLRNEWEAWLPHVEKALSELDTEKRETLTIGCQVEAHDIASSADTATLLVAHAMFNDFFDNQELDDGS